MLKFLDTTMERLIHGEHGMYEIYAVVTNEWEVEIRALMKNTLKGHLVIAAVDVELQEGLSFPQRRNALEGVLDNLKEHADVRALEDATANHIQQLLVLEEEDEPEERLVDEP